jgi:hypothetical protein
MWLGGQPPGPAVTGLLLEAAMFEIQMLIPVLDNDGVPFSPEEHEAFELKAAELVGGFSRYQGETLGGWYFEGRLYRDRTRVYGLAVEGLAGGAKVLELAAFAKAHYRQEAIFLRYLGVVEIFK